MPITSIDTSERALISPVQRQQCPLFQVLEQGNEKGLSEILDESLENPDFNHQELINKFPALVKSLSHFSEELSRQAAYLLRKMLFRVLVKNPQLIQERNSSYWEVSLNGAKKGSPLHFELMAMQEMLKQGRTSDWKVCFENICQRLQQAGVLEDSQLPEIARKTREMGKQALQQQEKMRQLAEESFDSLKEHEFKKNSQAKTSLEEMEQKAKQSEITQEWVRQFLFIEVDKETLKFHRERIQTLSLDSYLPLLRPYLKGEQAAPEQIESALDSISHKLNDQGKDNPFTELEKQYPHLCCPLTKKLMKVPVIAEDGFSYEEEAIETHFMKFNTSPKTGKEIGKKLIPNLALQDMIKSLKKEQNLKKKHLLDNKEEPSAKRPKSDVPRQTPVVSIDLEEIPQTLPQVSPAIAEEVNTPPIQQLLEMMHRNPQDASLYCRLGHALSEGKSVKLLDGRRMTQQLLYLKAIQLDPKNAFAYQSLGVTLPQGGSIQLFDRTTMTQQQLFVQAIQLDPKDALAYGNLGLILPEGGSIVFPGGTTMTKLQLYLKAIQLDPKNAFAYECLGVALPQGSSIQLLDGSTMTQQQLYLKAIQLDPKYTLAYLKLGATLPQGGSIQLLNGTTMTQQQLYLQAIQLKTKYAFAYHSLGVILPLGGSIQLLDGTTMTQQQLFLKVIQLDPNCASSYTNLGITLPQNGSIQLLDGTKMTKQQLYLKAIQLDPKNITAYLNLGYTLSQGSTIQFLDGTSMTRQQLFLKAIELNPNDASTYSYLGSIFTVGESIQLANGMWMTKENLLSKAQELKFPS